MKIGPWHDAKMAEDPEYAAEVAKLESPADAALLRQCAEQFDALARETLDEWTGTAADRLRALAGVLDEQERVRSSLANNPPPFSFP